MKVTEAIKALKEGKRIRRIPSDPPVNLCDHLSYDVHFDGFYQLYQHDKVLRLIPDVACAAKVAATHDLDKFTALNQYAYLNFEVYEE